MPQVVIVSSLGPQGPIGPQGPVGPTGSFDSATGSLVTTASFNAFTSSYNTASFTGSFVGSGAGLYNIPASGITGLNLSQIASGSATASISPSTGFRVNTNSEITGSLTVTGSSNLYGPFYNVGTYWETISGSNFQANLPWRGLAYGNGLFVAAADRNGASTSLTGSIATSQDGVQWTFRTLPALTGLTNIIYQNGIFVATGRVIQRAFYSYNGVDWFQGTGIGGQVYGLAYGDGKFIGTLIDNSGTRMTLSYNGRTWIGVNTPTSMDLAWVGATYGNGTFVAVAESTVSQSIAISYDGLSWNNVQRPTDGGFTTYQITYGNGLFVVTGNQGKILTSPDGINWTIRQTPLTGLIWKITYAEGLFIAAGSFSTTENRLIYSYDGITWKEAGAPSLSNWSGFAYGNGMLLSVAFNSTGSSLIRSGILKSVTTPGNNITHGAQTFTDSITVSGTGRFSSNLTVTGSATNSLLVKGSGATSSTTSLRIENANASASLVVTDIGRVLIGTTTDAGYKLDVSGGNLRVANTSAADVFRTADNGQNISYALNVQQNLTMQNDGTAAAPLLTFREPTGLFRTSTSGLGITVAGIERMRVTTGGNVGIGTTSPSATLDVSGSGNFTSNLTVTGSLITSALTASSAVISGNVTVLGTASINTLIVNQTQLSTGSNQLGDAVNDTQTLYGTVVIPTGSLTVTGSITQTASTASFGGVVGIGTSSPGKTLDIVGEVRASGRATFNEYVNTGFIFGNTDLVLAYSGGTTGIIVKGTTGNVGIGINDSPTSRLHVKGAGTTSSTTALLVQNSNASASLAVLDNGNVGIGLNNPQGATHIAVASGTPALVLSDVGSPNTIPTLQFRRGPLSAYSLQIDWPSNLKARFQIGDAVTGYEFTGGNVGLTGGRSIEFGGITGQTATAILGSIQTDNNNGQLLFSTRGSGTTAERARITNTGNFLISTSTDSGFKLDVSGSLRTTGNAVFQNSLNSTANFNIAGIHADGRMALYGTDSNGTIQLLAHRGAQSGGVAALFPGSVNVGGGLTGALGIGPGGLILQAYTVGTGGIGLGTHKSLAIATPDSTTGNFGGATGIVDFATYSTINNSYSGSRPSIRHTALAHEFRVDSGTGQTNPGTTVMIISGSGNVGIGTSTPTATLQVKGSGATNSTTALLVQNSSATPSLTIKDDLTTTFGGNLFTANNSVISGSFGYSGGDFIKIHGLNTNGQAKIVSYDYGTARTTELAFGSGDSHWRGLYKFSTNGYYLTDSVGSVASYERLRIDYLGRVGISNPNPSYRLDVSGSSNFTGNVLITGSVNIDGGLFDTVSTGSIPTGSTLIYTINTGSYQAGFFDYYVSSGSNFRAGNIMSVWGAGTYKFTDLATPDIGSTSNLQFSMSLSASSAQLFASASSAGWTVKTTFRTI